MPKIFCAFCGFSGIGRIFRKFTYHDNSKVDFLCNLCDTATE